ncbi:hypothetical protein GCM10020001_113910 [Nonomuraea salmonea]
MRSERFAFLLADYPTDAAGLRPHPSLSPTRPPGQIHQQDSSARERRNPGQANVCVRSAVDDAERAEVAAGQAIERGR